MCGDAYRRTRGSRTDPENLDSSVALVNTVAAHILNSGQTRPSPLRAPQRPSLRICRPGPLTLGSLVEFIHTATLLHDDVVDDADLRRGAGPRAKSGATKSGILVGDYLYFARSVRSSTSAIKGSKRHARKHAARWPKASAATVLQRQSADAGVGISPHRT
ncbi:MAG: polyprenyl synthetase family protein [Nitrospira sp.]|nr:polyprenyl synthetase family protein [Nitrospira sp.]